jgi:alpha-ketoglutarate-dependent taurine dioxygenase
MEPNNYFLTIENPEQVGTAPVVVTCRLPEVNLESWLLENRRWITDELLRYGAILVRGLPLHAPEDFSRSFKILFEDPLEYTFRTSPRDEVIHNIYTSTSHPADLKIHFHTENSYASRWNRIISFFCLVPAAEGGETPIADERLIIKKIRKRTLDKFRDKGILYVRNTLPGIGLPWQTIYQTEDKRVAEEYLIQHGMRFEWVTDQHLRTKWVLPAFQPHPVTGEMLWFNHMYFGHKSQYDPLVLELIEEEDLPFATYYGDGTAIEDEVIQEFRDAYEQCKIEFRWEKGDMLILDNMMFAHARNPFRGNRKILVAMSHVVEREMAVAAQAAHAFN